MSGPPWWQGDPRWAGVLLGTGPARCSAAGCVACALAAAAVRLAGRDLNPGSAIVELCGMPGAFVGDEIVVPVAAPALGLDAGPLVVGDADALRTALKAALEPSDGAALVRLEVMGEKIEHHTVLAAVDAGPFIECIDSACPTQDGVREGWCTLRWADLSSASPLRWRASERSYRVVAVRALRKAAPV